MLPPFWTLVEAHGAELMRYVRRLSGDGAEDVLQEAFLRALRSYPRLERADGLRAWLYRIATTTAYDHSRRKRAESLMPEVPDAGVEPSHDDGTFDELIGRLSRGAREAMRLRFEADLSYVEIAARLGCSPAAARQRVSTGVRELRKEMT